jgi:L-fuculose-phosphate aldolase
VSLDELARARGWSDEEARLRRAICEIGKLCYSRFYIVGADGNISARMNDGTVLITPAGAMKGFLEPQHIAHIDMRGEVLDGGPGASTEKGIHLTAYEVRPEMRAVCHAHPPHAVAMTIAGIDMQAPFIPEIIVTIGGIPTANFGTPGTPELADSIRNILKCSDTVVMTNHGSVTLGANLMDAYKKLDMVGHAKPLNAEYVQKLLATRGLLGIKTVNTLENECGVRRPN